VFDPKPLFFARFAVSLARTWSWHLSCEMHGYLPNKDNITFTMMYNPSSQSEHNYMFTAKT